MIRFSYLKTRTLAYVGVSLLIGLLIGIMVGRFLLIPNEVVITGTASSFPGLPAAYVSFLEVKEGVVCQPALSTIPCQQITNVTMQGTYSINVANGQTYAIYIGYKSFNSSSYIISIESAEWCPSGNLVVDTLSYFVSYNLTCRNSTDL